MIASEYLVRFGRLGDFGRFRAEPALACSRGQRVVIRTHRGLEIGEILRESEVAHVSFLPNTTVGTLLRHASPADRTCEQDHESSAQRLLLRACGLAASLNLPLAFLDVELLLDGRRAVLHHLTSGGCDPRELVSTLAREFDCQVELANLTESPPVEEVEEAEEESGCGSCGSEGGGCGSCGSGGCGSCDTTPDISTDRERFANLRAEMERQRTPLL